MIKYLHCIKENEKYNMKNIHLLAHLMFFPTYPYIIDVAIIEIPHVQVKDPRSYIMTEVP